MTDEGIVWVRMKILLIVALVAVVLARSANASPGTLMGAVAGSVAAGLLCDRLARIHIRSYSDEAWVETSAGITAGTACGILGGAVGAAAGTGATVGAAGLAVATVARAGGRAGVQAVGDSARHAAPYLKAGAQSVKQGWGRFKVGPVAPASNPLRAYMPRLYDKQKGTDALCKVPLPPLYVGPVWDRRLNPAIHVDHRIPKAKGGKDVLSNLQLTAAEFNLKKGTLTGNELRAAKPSFCPA